ncbi:GNAT family N-acetyltransferase [Streptomyces sp. NPDC090025]|uniref:GNAT family N-acetyltransferase n=1 Tax=Streptomyces sp. NPDC090025 TaxID=3365922 RepID=UPI0038354EB9
MTNAPDAPASVPPYVVEVDDELLLRRFEWPADFPELNRVIDESVEHLRPWMEWAEDHGPDGTASFLSVREELWEKGAGFTYAIVVGGAIVGSCGLYQHEDTPPDAYEIGYWLHPAATGKGLATRAARALIPLGFLLPGVRRLLVVHEPANRASAAVPHRLGFREQAPLRDGDDEYQVWALVRPESGPGS